MAQPPRTCQEMGSSIQRRLVHVPLSRFAEPEELVSTDGVPAALLIGRRVDVWADPNSESAWASTCRRFNLVRRWWLESAGSISALPRPCTAVQSAKSPQLVRKASPFAIARQRSQRWDSKAKWGFRRSGQRAGTDWETGALSPELRGLGVRLPFRPHGRSNRPSRTRRCYPVETSGGPHLAARIRHHNGVIREGSPDRGQRRHGTIDHRGPQRRRAHRARYWPDRPRQPRWSPPAGPSRSWGTSSTPSELARAMRGCDAVVNFATRVPIGLTMLRPRSMAHERPDPQPRRRHRRGSGPRGRGRPARAAEPQLRLRRPRRRLDRRAQHHRPHPGVRARRRRRGRGRRLHSRRGRGRLPAIRPDRRSRPQHGLAAAAGPGRPADRHRRARLLDARRARRRRRHGRRRGPHGCPRAPTTSAPSR